MLEEKLCMPNEVEAVSMSLEQSLSELFLGKKVIHIDRPCHFNIGDMLIDKGFRHFLKKNKISVFDRFCQDDISRLFKINLPSDVVIALHGGGNFGDIYEKHEALRKKIIQAFPHNFIVIMPQSVHYSDPVKFKEMADIIISHKNIKVLVRDKESFEFLSQQLPVDVIRLVPDCAMLLYPISTLSDPTSDTLILRRKDVESITNEKGFDWRDIVYRKDRKLLNVIKKLQKLEVLLNIRLGSHVLLDSLQDSLIKRAVNVYARYNRIDTDRLHGAILGVLMNKNLVLRDNSYGKINRYMNAWFK